jgi:tRNA (Thr-GGU) A37 N-methylase
MSVLELKRVRGLQLWVGNCDLLDGTPVLDIKPYLAEYDSFPASEAGWWDAERVQEHHFTIEISPNASEQLAFLAEHNVHIVEHLRHILERDPFPHPYHRIKKKQKISNDAVSEGSDMYEIAHKEWRLHYTIHNNQVLIREVRSGFLPECLSDNDTLHREFQKLFE